MLWFCICALAVFALSSDNAASEEGSDATALSREQQEEAAQKVFMSILDMTSTPDRASIIPELEKSYLSIIRDYPLAGLVHESYWRLVLIAVNDYTPPDFEKALTYVEEYERKFPDIGRKSVVGDVLAEAYYRSARWEDLLKYCRPVVKEYIDKGVLTRPNELFWHAEAKLHLGDREEALKGYRIVVEKFPRTLAGSMAQKRLADMEKDEQKK